MPRALASMAIAASDWGKLRHAYGLATDIPGLLARASSAPAPQAFDDEPWFSLWSALCHQGTVYPASYAAVVELVGIAFSREGGARAECLLLAACIEVERHAPDAPAMPDSLQESYAAALDAGAHLAATAMSQAKSPADSRRLQIAVAAFNGDRTSARRLLDDESETE